MAWKTRKIKADIAIQGLPGIGSVGKLVVDYMIDKLNAKKIGEYIDNKKPSLLLIEKDELIAPSIELFFDKKNKVLFITGNYQPLTDTDSWKYGELTAKKLKELGVKELIVIGGVNLNEEKSRVFLFSKDQKLRDKLKKKRVILNVHKYIGTIIGGAATLLSCADKKKIKTALILGEAMNEYLPAISSSRTIIKIIANTYKLKINTKELDKEVRKGKELMKKIFKKEDTQPSYIG